MTRKYNFDAMCDEVTVDLPDMEVEELREFYKMLMRLTANLEDELKKRLIN